MRMRDKLRVVMAVWGACLLAVISGSHPGAMTTGCSWFPELLRIASCTKQAAARPPLPILEEIAPSSVFSPVTSVCTSPLTHHPTREEDTHLYRGFCIGCGVVRLLFAAFPGSFLVARLLAASFLVEAIGSYVVGSGWTWLFCCCWTYLTVHQQLLVSGDGSDGLLFKVAKAVYVELLAVLPPEAAANVKQAWENGWAAGNVAMGRIQPQGDLIEAKRPRCTLLRLGHALSH
jgi:hypothetical protein